ncbi:BRICHOS domain-containing protein 5 isoform X1 [Phyllopteryx taeniolatus]|uniref:BRICHOS domain-containing protein 5 isoform X1 n=1 Tax=Phyllopteryx taeniolatus TaxID=161469 RepID=UPI002AD54BB2|nr:BRICHOS domain-containing protein 5 isoform X1 [Phyllopteryx taeniolatus]XP_061612850.1 BRICHOS domain-containing protein 5 isoform X1 [Phyllopteryx taeniolatus]XP_061612851.1 BRICHOS domain-containing protein 5 isoform X1 [Phyllopteryx taeniolatus]
MMGHRMVRCWNLPEGTLEGGGCMNGGSSTSHHIPKKALCVSLSASLLLVFLTLGLTGHLGVPQQHSQSTQAVRFTGPDPSGVLLLNQLAAVDQQNGLVTFSVTTGANQTSTVLFDIKHGLICYRPVHQESCFLRTMETSDYENVHSVLQASVNKQSQFQLSANETQRHTEFLGVLAASQVDVSALEEPLKLLCQDRPIYWTKRAEGPGKQRLVYFCIDICFPNNICVSVCFYYLPE